MGYAVSSSQAAVQQGVSITSIVVTSFPCNQTTATGTITFSGPYSGTVTLIATSHLPGASTFEPTGGTTTVTLTGQSSSTFSINVNLVPGANAYRVEVQSASDPNLGGLTTKGNSFNCTEFATSTPTTVPTSTSTPVPTSTETAVPTSTETSVPTETSTVTPTATETETSVPTSTPTSTSVAT